MMMIANYDLVMINMHLAVKLQLFIHILELKLQASVRVLSNHDQSMIVCCYLPYTTHAPEYSGPASSSFDLRAAINVIECANTFASNGGFFCRRALFRLHVIY